MRMDWFLPHCGRQVPGRDSVRHPSRPRRALRWIGPSVAASPLRRAVQAGAFLLFVTLFYYVCWPYTARPAPEGKQSSGWQMVGVDQESGGFRFQHAAPPAWVRMPNTVVHVVSAAAMDDVEGSAGAFDVSAGDAREISLEPVSALTAEQFDRLVTGLGPWTIRQQAPDSWPSHYASDLARKERVPADLFLTLDPLVSLSTAVAARTWVWSLACAAVILIVCLVIPRGFCGYLCPLGTVIDLFDWGVSRRVTRLRVSGNGWWVYLKYYLLGGILIGALCGVLIAGAFAAIPVITRALLFLTEPLQTGALRGWHLTPAMNPGHVVSMVLFLSILLLGLLRPRFWCKYVCPTGAVFSLGNLLRIMERKVESSCVRCNKCLEICPFDAIRPDFTTRGSDCTFCQSCGGACPTHAIKFVDRWNGTDLKTCDVPPTNETGMGRRGFLSWSMGGLFALAGGVAGAHVIKASHAAAAHGSSWVPVRPPGSVPEPEFLRLCIRCGECLKVCPNNVLQAEAFEQGLEGLWTPLVNANWAGCESSCNACGQVCPTGAIRALPLEEKRCARMGLATVNQQTCLPLANREACQLCVDECNDAGYGAVEFMRVHTRVDESGQPLDDTGYLAPVVSAVKCVGCGLCQTRCHIVNVKQRGLLDVPAIVVEAGQGREDRMMRGSYVRLRIDEERQRRTQLEAGSGAVNLFLPDGGTPDTAGTVEERKLESPF